MPLRPILEKIKSSPAGECLVIFDLDSTLYDLTKRVGGIMAAFAGDAAVVQKFPEASARLTNLEIRRTDWGIHEPFARVGITRESHPEFVNAAQAAWARGFFSNDFLDRDFPLPGAVQFVEDCLQAGAEVLYLTGRDVARMGAGTATSLRASGFPFDGVRSRLQLKPDKSLDDAEFKADVIADLNAKYPNIWLFENEPVNINAVLKRTPQVKMVFVETCHSGLEDVVNPHARISTFDGHLISDRN